VECYFVNGLWIVRMNEFLQYHGDAVLGAMWFILFLFVALAFDGRLMSYRE
jgi:hypothetical protein